MAILGALVAGCGSTSNVTSDAGDSGDGDGNITTSDAGDGSSCNYPPANNDPRCPATYSYSNFGQPCPAIGLTCAYPGAGDGTSNGCFATAMMWCHGDGGADAGPGTWTVAQ